MENKIIKNHAGAKGIGKVYNSHNNSRRGSMGKDFHIWKDNKELISFHFQFLLSPILLLNCAIFIPFLFRC